MAGQGVEVLCVVSALPLRRWRDVIPFLRMTYRVDKQLKETPGLVRHAVKANFLRKRFWTFSAWRDRESMVEFVRSEPHATAVKRFEVWGGEGAAFAEWQSVDGSIDWTGARERLRDPTFRYGQQRG
ncbi:MAG: hypothetical protein ACE5KI_00810 [Dehalococcoidia bacterium]